MTDWGLSYAAIANHEKSMQTMRRRIQREIFLLLCLLVFVPVQGQTYEGLWAQVEEVQKKGLVQTANRPCDGRNVTFIVAIFIKKFIDFGDYHLYLSILRTNLLSLEN